MLERSVSVNVQHIHHPVERHPVPVSPNRGLDLEEKSPAGRPSWADAGGSVGGVDACAGAVGIDS